MCVFDCVALDWQGVITSILATVHTFAQMCGHTGSNCSELPVSRSTRYVRLSWRLRRRLLAQHTSISSIMAMAQGSCRALMLGFLLVCGGPCLVSIVWCNLHSRSRRVRYNVAQQMPLPSLRHSRHRHI